MSQLHFTIRKMNIKKHIQKLKNKKQEYLQDIIVLVVISLFIGFLAPFGMTELPWISSVGFWFLVCFIGYLIYRPLLGSGTQVVNKYINNIWLSAGFCLLVASALMAFVVPLVVILYFNIEVSYQAQYWSVFQKSLVIGGVISAVSTYKAHVNKQKQQLAEIQHQHAQNKQQLKSMTNSHINKFMSLLPVEKRGELYCLQMDDHYVKVYTDKGHHMLLMRFKDALGLLEDYDGLQTHRSWWVSKQAVKSVLKEQRKTTLVLINQLEVPVSRTYSEAVKQANLF